MPSLPFLPLHPSPWVGSYTVDATSHPPSIFTPPRLSTYEKSRLRESQGSLSLSLKLVVPFRHNVTSEAAFHLTAWQLENNTLASDLAPEKHPRPSADRPAASRKWCSPSSMAPLAVSSSSAPPSSSASRSA